MRHLGRAYVSFFGSRLLVAILALLSLPHPVAAAAGQALVTTPPCRAVDTRNPVGSLGGPALDANEIRIFTLTGTCGVPPNALGLAVNLTVVAPAAMGYAQLYAGDAAAPTTLVLAFSAGKTRASNTIVALASDSSGTVALANVSTGAADFIIDISGYWVPACTSTITVTNPGAATGSINAPFSQTFTETGGTGTTTFSTASPLPTGLTLAANGTLSGTPTQPGTFPITVTATDANGCTGTSPTYTLVITCQTITVTNPVTTTGTANVPFSQTFTETGGVGTTTFSTASPLPVGMTLAANGLLSGTPTQAGVFPIVVTATDADGCTGSGPTYNLVINCQTITVTNPAVTGGTAGSAFSQTFTQSGAIGTATFTTASTLPAGLTLGTNGTLSGTPTQTGTFPIVVKVTDGNLCTGTGATYSLVIGCGTITVTNPATAIGTAGTFFSQTFAQSGAIGTATFTTASTLPTGLTLATNGTLSGTPTQTGSFSIVVTVTDGNGCTGTSSTYTLVIGCQSYSVQPAGIPQGTVNVAYQAFAFTQTGGIGTVTFSTVSTLPNGLTLASDGTLSGTPTQIGTFPITVTATDANGCTASRDYLLVIACSGTTITLSPSSLGTVLAGSAFPTTQFMASGGTGPYTFAIAGALPTGMNFSVDTLSGTPTQTGTFPITISATDSVGGCAGSQDYVITVTCNGVTIMVSPASLAPATAGTSYGPVTFSVSSGGTPPYTLAETGALPTGMTYSSSLNQLSGTPMQGGTFPITVTATDAAGCTGATVYSFVVVCPTITVTNPGVTTGTVDAAFSQTFTQTGASGTATFTTSSTLPPGFTLSPAGVLSGTPSVQGTFPITVKVTDSNGCTGTSSYTLVISCQTITVTNPGVNTGTVDAAFSQTFTQSGVGTHTPAMFTTASTLPAGLTLATNGTLSGTPTAPGTFDITVTVTDANGCTGTSANYHLVIACQAITVTNPPVSTSTFNTALSPAASYTFTQSGVGTHTPLTFAINSGTLPTGVTISPAGVLSGTPSVTGTFPITVKVTDANGCTGTSGTYTLTVKPVAAPDTYNNLINNTQAVVTGGGTGSPATPFVPLTGTVIANDQPAGFVTLTTGTFATAGGGSVTIAADGTFIYTPPLTNLASDTFTYTISSNTGGTSTAAAANGTVTLNLANRVWYVKNNAGAGIGQSQSPFNSLASAAGASTANDIIYVYFGDGTTTNQNAGITLKNGQLLTGEGVALVVNAVTLRGAGSSPSITNGSGNVVTLANGNTIQGLTLTGSANALVFGGSGVTGTTTLNTVVMTPSGAANGVSLTSQAAGHTFNYNSGSITSSSSGAAVLMSGAGGAGPATFSIAISSSSGRPIDISSRTAGTVAFNGAVSGTSQGVSLTTNTGSTITFTGGISISTGANAAFTATGGGTVSATQNNTSIVNTLTTTIGTALNVANTTIGAAGLTFRSITANGGANGIILNTTGATGGLTVSGTGSAGSGGTIRNMVGADGAVAGNGIYLNSATNPSFSWMQLNDFQNFAIYGTSVSGFTFDNSVINGSNGNNASGNGEGSIAFDGLTGSVSVSNSNISGGVSDNIRVTNTSGSLNRFIFSGSTIGPNNTSTGNAGILLEGSGTATINATIQNSFFTASVGDLFHYNVSGGTAGGDLVFTGNTLSNSFTPTFTATGGGGITIGGGNGALVGGNNLTFNISNNTFRDAVGAGVLIFKSTDPGTFSGTFANNTIGVKAVANSGSYSGDGIKIQNAGGGAVTVHVTGNQIYQYNQFGMDLETGGGATAQSGTLNLTITGNTVGTVGNLGSINTQGVMLDGGTVPGDTYAICLTLGGAGALANDIRNSGAGGSGTDFRIRQRENTTVTLPGYGGANNDNVAVQNFITANNVVAVAGSATNTVGSGGGGFVNGGPCP